MHSGSLQTPHNPSVQAESEQLHFSTKSFSNMDNNNNNSKQLHISHPSNLYPISTGSSPNLLNHSLPLDTEHATDASSEPDSQSQDNIDEQAAMPNGLENLASALNSAAAANDSNQGRWTKEEHVLFIEGLSLFGKNWKKVEEHVGSRTGAQIRSHAQKFFNKLERTKNKKQYQSSTSYPSKNHLSTYTNATSIPTTLNSNILREKSLSSSQNNIPNQQYPQIFHEQPSTNQISKTSSTSKSTSLHPTLTHFPSSELPSYNYSTARNRSDSHASCMSTTTSVLNQMTDEDQNVKDKTIPLTLSTSTSSRESNHNTISNCEHTTISHEHQDESQISNSSKVQWSTTAQALQMIALANPVAQQIQGLIQVIQSRLLQTAMNPPQSLSVQRQEITSNKENQISQQTKSDENELLNNIRPSSYESFFEFVQSKYGGVFGCQEHELKKEKSRLINIISSSQKQEQESQRNQKQDQLLPPSINLKRKSSFTLCESQSKQQQSTATSCQNLNLTSLRKRICPVNHNLADLDSIKPQQRNSLSSNNNQSNTSLF